MFETSSNIEADPYYSVKVGDIDPTSETTISVCFLQNIGVCFSKNHEGFYCTRGYHPPYWLHIAGDGDTVCATWYSE